MPNLVEFLSEHALVLAAALPPAVRIAGHWLPEEPLMVALGVVAATRGGKEGFAILAVAWASHFLTDQAVAAVGRRLRPRILRVGGTADRVMPMVDRLGESRRAVWWLVPARVLPLGRGAWLLAAGVANVPMRRLAAVDAAAVAVHVAFWCGLGWFTRTELALLPGVIRSVALWAVAAALGSSLAVTAWRRFEGSQAVEAVRQRWLQGGP